MLKHYKSSGLCKLNGTELKLIGAQHCARKHREATFFNHCHTGTVVDFVR